MVLGENDDSDEARLSRKNAPQIFAKIVITMRGVVCLPGRQARSQPLHDEVRNERSRAERPCRRRGPGHRAVGCDRASYRQAPA
jgi:hypothetical protein